MTRRSGGITAIGILNIVFGSLGAIVSLLIVIGGGLFAGAGAMVEADAGAEAEGFGAAAGVAGGLIMIVGLIGLVSAAALGVSGIGVLMLRPWGRVLSIVCGASIVLLNLLSLVSGGGNLVTLVAMIYGGLLVGLFFTPKWKAVFQKAPAAATVQVTDRFQAAA
jgi:hypothetical protein